jgi:peptidyl-prolyl cis-trans isomerase A (cyclophilin A)
VKDAASQQVVDKIANAKTGARDKPLQAIKITSISFK